jgi:hypothetical protein
MSDDITRRMKELEKQIDESLTEAETRNPKLGKLLRHAMEKRMGNVQPLPIIAPKLYTIPKVAESEETGE